MKNITCKHSHIIAILVSYAITQGLLLVVDGIWWDDWCGYDTYVGGYGIGFAWNRALDYGRPLSILNYHINLLPFQSYRFLVFIYFLFINLILYEIVKHVTGNEDKALFITIIFCIFPVFDCRMMRCIYSYSISYFEFAIASYLMLVREDKADGEGGLKYISRRFLIVGLYFLSFNTSSFLVFFFIPLGLFLYNRCNRLENSNVKDIINVVKKNVYFILTPFLYWMVKSVFFAPRGVHGDAGYNAVTSSGLFAAIIQSLYSPYVALHELANNFLNRMPYVKGAFNIFAFLAITYGLISFIIKIILKEIHFKTDIKRLLIGLLFGYICTACGMFPYIAVRGNVWNMRMGVGSGGRDLMLTALGLSIMVYYLADFLFRKKGLAVFSVMACSFSCVYFFVFYTNYQTDSYWQYALSEQFKQNQELRTMNNLLLIDEWVSPLGLPEFYELNGLGYLAYGNRTRLIFLDNEIWLLDSEDKYYYKDTNYWMSEYDASQSDIDAIVCFNCPISTAETVKLKFLQMFDQEEYSLRMRNMGRFSYRIIDKAESDKIIFQSKGGG